MIELSYEMTFRERIEGPLGPAVGSPRRVCWKVAQATLIGSRVKATLAMPETDWMRIGNDGNRRPDQHAQLLTDDGVLILMRYDVGIVRADAAFTAALTSGAATDFATQYMYMVPQFEVSDRKYSWLTDNLFIGRGRLAGPKQIEYAVHRIA